MTMKRRICWLLVLGLASVTAAADSPCDQDVLSRWLDHHGSIDRWSADVTQVRSLKTLTRPLTSTGQLWFAQPNQFRWQLGDPPKTIAVRKDDVLMVVYPRLKQAERFPLGKEGDSSWGQALALLEVGLPNGAETFCTSYELTDSSSEDGTWAFDLRPADPSARRLIERVRLEVTDADLLLTATEIVFPDGSSMRNEFSGHRFNPEIDGAVFEVEIDDSYEIVEPMAGR
jgi:outer membrane lipoprotein-sorting protein